MEFGKLPDISGVDFSLPPEPEANRTVLARVSPDPGPPVFYVGCTGWSMPQWVGKVYPPKTKSTAYLYHYSRQFNTIELNTTHYRIPDFDTVQKWKSESAQDFRFCPKVPQTISHSNDLGLGGPLIPQFCDSVAGLEEKMGCCFLQLPPYFGPDRIKILENFLKAWPAEIPLAVEMRQENWFKPGEGQDALWDLLEDNGVAAVITDAAGRRDVAHMRLTAPRTMVRFVGNNLHPTDYRRIDQWAERTARWFEEGLEEIFFFTHEPDNILAPDLAVYLCDQLQPVRGLTWRGPQMIQSEGSGQMSLF
ncbi:MAG TPA: DUF72 domain-containing protein [Flavilitoribacter sp.]|nr:DUF72 domain-containing protein [Flavilitoribacter sp.]